MAKKLTVYLAVELDRTDGPPVDPEDAAAALVEEIDALTVECDETLFDVSARTIPPPEVLTWG